jgi:hypothetical protein
MNRQVKINRFIAIVYCLFFCLNVEGQKIFMPDYSLNSIIKIEDTTGISNFLPNGDIIQQYVIDKNERVYILFTNLDKTEYAKAIFHEGTYFTFYEIEFGKMDKILCNEVSIKLPIKHFITESGVFLDMTKNELFDLKGNNTIFVYDNSLCYCYNSNKDVGGKSIKDCEYIYKVTFAEDRVSKIHFGFQPL